MGLEQLGYCSLSAKRDADGIPNFSSGKFAQLSICLLPSPHRASLKGDEVHALL